MTKLKILAENGDILNSKLEPSLKKSMLINALKTMIQVRLLNNKGIQLQRQGKVVFHVFTIGQEAHIGAALALTEEDWVFPAYREHGMGIYRGIPPEDIVNHFFSNDLDPQKGRRLPGLFGNAKVKFVTPSAPIGTQIIQAAGTAYASNYKKENAVTIVFFGDGATSANDFHSGLNFAGVTNSPVIFVCMNNQWAISVPLKSQTAQTDIYKKANAYGIHGVQIDGNDIFAFYHAVNEACKRHKKGLGPTLIEAITYRIGPHTSSDDPTRYREEKEVRIWKDKDPIERFKKYLVKKEISTKAEIKKLERYYDKKLNEVIMKADNRGKPKAETLFEDVFSDMPYSLQRQRAESLSLQEGDN